MSDLWLCAKQIILLIYKGSVLLQYMKLLILQLFEVITYWDASVPSVFLINFLGDLLGPLTSEQAESGIKVTVVLLDLKS